MQTGPRNSTRRRTPDPALSAAVAVLAVLSTLGLGLVHAPGPVGAPASAAPGRGLATAGVPTVSAGGVGALGGGVGRDATVATASSPPPLDFQWTNVTGASATSPPSRTGAGMAWDAADGYFLLFGGNNPAGLPDTDTWTYSNGSWTNITSTLLGTPPPLIGSLAYDPSTHSVLLFGALRLAGTPTSFTWSYHNRAWSNLTTSSGPQPSGRTGNFLATDTTDNGVLMFGGYRGSSGTFGNDTWRFQSGHWTNITAAVGPIRGNFLYGNLGDDPAVSGDVLTIGSFFASAFQTQTFLFSNDHWQNVTPSPAQSPPLAGWSEVGYLPAISAFVWSSTGLIQPNGARAYLAVTWEFVRGAWVNVTSATDTGYYAIAAVGAADPVDSSFLLNGGVGNNGPYYHATWVLSSAPRVVATASKTVVDAGQTALVNATVSGGLSPVTLSWAFSDGSSGATAQVTHTFSTSGTTTATATATDRLGRSGTSTVAVAVNPPVAVAPSSAPSGPTAGAAVTLLAGLSGGTAPFTYNWTFGDSGSSTQASPTHAFATSGTYTVHLTVTDSDGIAGSGSIVVTVSTAPASSSGGGGVSLTTGTGLGLLLGLIIALVGAVLFAVLWVRASKRPPSPPSPAH